VKWEYRFVDVSYFNLENHATVDERYHHLDWSQEKKVQTNEIPAICRGSALMNRLGRDGWELVTTITQPDLTHPVTGAAEQGASYMVFKRLLEDDEGDA
jgi:hypothetical protein